MFAGESVDDAPVGEAQACSLNDTGDQPKEECICSKTVKLSHAG